MHFQYVVAAIDRVRLQTTLVFETRSPANGLTALFPGMILLEPDRKVAQCGDRQVQPKTSDLLFMSVAPNQT
jgi:hypothetical protein